jgi:hypothetical protein
MTRVWPRLCWWTILLLGSAGAYAGGTPLGTAFTYQGQFKVNGAAASGTYHLRFQLWDALTGGAQVGSDIDEPAVAITEGLFTTPLDFGPGAFDGAARWLAVQVVTNGGATVTTLQPRQAIALAPYAMQTRGLFVDAANKVGIGTSAPAYPLHVRAEDPVLVLQDQGPASQQVGYVTFWNNAAAETAWVGFGSPGSTDFTIFNGRGDVHLYTNAGRVLTGKAGGNVGIGTTTPSEKLSIAGSMEIGTGSADYQHMRIGGGNSSGFLYGSFPAYGDGIHMGYNYFANATGGHQVIQTDGGTSRISAGYGTIRFALGNPGLIPTDRIVITPGLMHVLLNKTTFDSNVQIGPDFTGTLFSLSVNGTAGKPGGGSWSVLSDRRLKKDIQPLHGALDQLLRLKGVSFEYVDPKSIGELSGPRMGMIAQDVEQVFPDWVQELSNGYKALTIRGFEALAVEALRDLRAEKDAEIAALREGHDNLRRENEALRDRLDQVEKAVRQLAHSNGEAK